MEKDDGDENSSIPCSREGFIFRGSEWEKIVGRVSCFGDEDSGPLISVYEAFSSVLNKPNVK